MKTFMNTVRVLICVSITAQMIGCGTIMYPERKGQKGGKIDAGVAVLDGLGLLLFLIPGIIAFAVDFNNGTIYLPGTRTSSLQMKDVKVVKFDPKHSNAASIERIIKEETGVLVKLDEPDMEITKFKSKDEMLTQLAKVVPVSEDRIALIR
jgi:hypothetical protein